MRASQARFRESALEAIVASARRELDAVGQQLDVAVAAVAGRIDKAEVFADNAGDSAAGAEARVSAAGEELGRASEEWTRSVVATCSELGRASEETATFAEREIADAARHLRALVDRQAPFQDRDCAGRSEKEAAKENEARVDGTSDVLAAKHCEQEAANQAGSIASKNSRALRLPTPRGPLREVN